MSRFPNDERVETLTAKEVSFFPSLSFPSSSGFIMFHPIPVSRKIRKKHTSRETWAADLGTLICLPFLSRQSTGQRETPAMNQRTPKDLRLDQDVRIRRGPLSGIIRSECACVRELHCRFCILLAQQRFWRGGFSCFSILSLLQFPSFFVREA